LHGIRGKKSEKNTKFMTIFGKCNPKLGSKTYGFRHQRPMGYGLWLTYGLWYAFPCPPSWWTAGAMGYKRLWVMTGPTVILDARLFRVHLHKASVLYNPDSRCPVVFPALLVPDHSSNWPGTPCPSAPLPPPLTSVQSWTFDHTNPRNTPPTPWSSAPTTPGGTWGGMTPASPLPQTHPTPANAGHYPPFFQPNSNVCGYPPFPQPNAGHYPPFSQPNAGHYSPFPQPNVRHYPPSQQPNVAHYTPFPQPNYLPPVGMGV